MEPEPEKEKTSGPLAGKPEAKNESPTNLNAETLQFPKDEVKSNSAQSLLLFRGLLIDEFLHIQCPVCDHMHSHEWFGNGYGDEEVVKAQCKNQPYVKSYRVAPIKKKDLARMEEAARESGIYLPLKTLAEAARAKARAERKSHEQN